MQFEVHFKNGIRLVSNEDLVKSVYNNPDVEEVVLMRNNRKFSVHLKPDFRLIFFREIKLGSEKEVIYNIGYQQTIRGKNIKTIMKIMPNDEIILVGE